MKNKKRISARLQHYEEAAVKKIGALGIFERIRGEKMEREIYEALSDIRNMTYSSCKNIGTDAVISRLAERDGVLKNTYIQMLSFIRTGRTEQAEKLMQETVKTETGRQFAGLLMAWEYTSPDKLEEIIISYRRNIQEAYITRRKKRDEVISDLLYFPATMNVFLIFINFIYISYFASQKEMLSVLF